MAKYRHIHITYWQDPFVEDLKPLQKYFYLYLLTNSKTTQCGCYEISDKLIKYETGFDQKQIDEMLKYFADNKKIAFDRTNNEILIVNWLKHNSFQSPKVKACIVNELKYIKTEQFKRFINNIIEKNTTMDSLSIDYEYTIDSESQQKEKEKEKEKQKNELTPLEVSINNFIKHRKELKKPMTEHAKDLFEKKLMKELETDDQRIYEINKAIMKGWQDIYPEKTQQSTQQNSDGTTVTKVEIESIPYNPFNGGDN